MAYCFEGIITKVDKTDFEKLKETLPPSSIEFFEPFHGFCCPVAETEDKNELILKSKKLPSQKYIFMRYYTWGGAIDFVSGFIYQNGNIIKKTIQEGEEKEGEEIFKTFFLHIGHKMQDTYFKPFERNFLW